MEFISGSSTKLDLDTLIGQQLQTMRRLTDQSARLIQSLWDSAAQSDPAEFDRIQKDLEKYDELNREVKGLARREQSFLRRHLFQGQEKGHCVICGEELLVSLLVAAHIKPRAYCTDEERRDYINNAAPICLLGCDALFERGIIIVEDDGKVRVRTNYDESDGLGKLLKRLDGKAILSWETGRNSEQPTSWAIGWAIVHDGDHNFSYHSGDDTGWHTIVVASAANKSGFVAMTNGESGSQVLRKVLMSDSMQRILKAGR